MFQIKQDPSIHVGEIHGIYKIIGVCDYKNKEGRVVFQCLCTQCGHIKNAPYNGIVKSEQAVHCSHVRAGYIDIKSPHHWQSRRLRTIYSDMIRRCYNSNDKNYNIYGAKGIRVYRPWLIDPQIFEDWAMTNGYTDELSIDRIDSNKDYCPDNCRWISMSDNSRFKSTTRIIDVDGTSQTGRQWADTLNIGTNTVNAWVRKYGVETVVKIIRAMLKDMTPFLNRRPTDSVLTLYNID